jgi:ubiquitin-activating enzyme E1
MRLLEAPSALLSVVAILLTSSQLASATPFSKLNDLIQRQLEERSNEEFLLQNATLDARSITCAAGSFNCGYYGQICCVSGSQSCGTNANNEAICVAGSSGSAATGAGTWSTYTSTWVDSVTKTSVYSTWVPATATTAVAGATCTPNWANNESGCGAICCSSGQYCFDASRAICTTAANGVTTTGTGYVAPLRPTSSGGVVTTQTISPTTTIPFQTPVATGSQNATLVNMGTSGSHLSGGAIAGIVIGVLAGIALLIFICFLCCLKAGIDGILALFGLGNKRRKSRRVVEEEYIETHRRHGSGAAGSDRRWYGSGGSRPSRPPPPPRKSGGGFGGLLGGTAALGGLALALGLKRKHDRREEEKSDISSSYGTYSYDYSSSKCPRLKS